MIRVGCYNWFHDRTDPDAVGDIFQDCDVVLLQRFPEVLCAAFGNSEYVQIGNSMVCLVRVLIVYNTRNYPTT